MYQDKLHCSALLQLPECFQRLESPFVSLYFTLSIYEEEDKGDENEVLRQVTFPRLSAAAEVVLNGRVLGVLPRLL